MADTAVTPFTTRHGDELVPNAVAHGGWGPTLGGQVIGGLLARAIEQQVDDPDLHPARLTVDILRRVATEPVRTSASVLRAGRRMCSMDATMTQAGDVVARASALFLRRSAQPPGRFWTTPVELPAVPDETDAVAANMPMFVQAYGSSDDADFPWQHDGPRYAWVREFRDLVQGESMTAFVRAAMAVDITASMANFSTAGLGFINADYTLTLSRLPDGPYIGLAVQTHSAADGIATGSTALFDRLGQIGIGLSTAIASTGFDPAGRR